MNTLFVLLLALAAPESAVPWGEVTLSIQRDSQTSSDHVTLCRVRITNHGSRSWPGRSIAFEARALTGAAVVARERGRFGLVLEPYGTLETLIGFTGRFDRFEVVPARGAGGRSPRGGRSEATAPGRRKGRKARG
jgi:hypothetical protein